MKRNDYSEIFRLQNIITVNILVITKILLKYFISMYSFNQGYILQPCDVLHNEKMHI